MTDNTEKNLNNKAATAALIAFLMATAGGAAFLKHHEKPTLRQVFAACEKGELQGIACCEDMRTIDPKNLLKTCGMVQPGAPDPLGVRKAEEDAWDNNTK